MRLIDADTLLRDAMEKSGNLIRIDGMTTFGAFLDFINEQKPLLKHAAPDEFVIAPCPACGSAEVVISISKRKFLTTELYYGRIRCLSCGQHYGLYAPTVQDVYRVWNNEFCKTLERSKRGKQNKGSV